MKSGSFSYALFSYVVDVFTQSNQKVI